MINFINYYWKDKYILLGTGRELLELNIKKTSNISWKSFYSSLKKMI